MTATGPPKELTVSAAVTSGPTGLVAPASRTLTITGRRRGANRDVEAGSGVDLGGRRQQLGDRNAERRDERGRDADGVGDGRLARIGERLRAEHQQGADDCDLPEADRGRGRSIATGPSTAGRTSSTGTVVIGAEDDDDGPREELTVSAAVTSGPTGLVAPVSRTRTMTDNETAPTVTLKLDPASISAGQTSSSGDGDDHGGERRRRRPGPEGDGDRNGDRRQRRRGAGQPYADGHRTTRRRRG